jgi:hypothetical protein
MGREWGDLVSGGCEAWDRERWEDVGVGCSIFGMRGFADVCSPFFSFVEMLRGGNKGKMVVAIK